MVQRLVVGHRVGDHLVAVGDSLRAVLAERLQPAIDGRLGQPARGGDLPAALAGERQRADLRKQGLLPQPRGGGRFFFRARHGQPPSGRYLSTDITEIAQNAPLHLPNKYVEAGPIVRP